MKNWMNRNLAIIFFVMMISFSATAQNKEVLHAVKSGETLSMLAKKYHTTVGDIMRANDMNSKSILKIGKKIKIPTASSASAKKEETKKNAAKSSSTKQTAGLKKDIDATIHVVEGKETLYSISKKYDVTVAQLIQWNDLRNDNIHPGQKLVIIPETKEQVANNVAAADKIVEKKTAPPVQQQTSVVTENKPVEKQAAVETNNASEKNVLQASNANNSQQSESAVNPKNAGNEGYFASMYQDGKNELSGEAATLKTASGWLDKKYYVLINNIDAGTIVRVNANNKSVFAKVLGPLPDVKEDNGLLLRICNAAATELGAADSKFAVTVNY
ncbi:muramidase-2 precursor [mine drainage metagenome]|uniref:Muramidase-2 n=1 Tax=mine drainage metagenome TaxID=410659 RepID=A0A1J5RZH1_9ZZZZ